MRNVAIPKLGLTMVDATILEWKAADGDRVEQGQPLLVIETEKVEYEIEAIASGILHIITPEGEIVPVGQLVAVLAEDATEYEAIASGAVPVGSGEKVTAIEPAAEPAPAGQAGQAPVAAAETGAAAGDKLRISPLARKLAEEHHVDISRVSGTGPGGRITKDDILRTAEEQKLAPKAAPAEAAPPVPAPAPAGSVLDMAEAADLKRLRVAFPLRGMRRAIAEHMRHSLAVSAQMSSGGEVDASEIVRIREQLVERQQEIGERISYTDLLVFITARALRHHPLVNASIVGDEIRVWESINIGVATFVELEEVAGITIPGLLVPVVRDADKKSLVQIHREIRDLTEKARQRKLLPDEMSGGTFTITNPAGAGGAVSRFGTPIINQPEMAILGLGEITEKEVVRQGDIVARPVLAYFLTYDHRLIDGVMAHHFLGTLIEYIADPHLLLLDVP